VQRGHEKAKRTAKGQVYYALAGECAASIGYFHLLSKQPMPAKPKLGQNFLNDAQAIERIAVSLGDLSGRTVVEIGPGAGAITGALAARAAHVLAVELDHGFAAYLRTEFSPDRVAVVEQDVLQFDFTMASAAAGERLLVAGNLPYGITSQILLKLTASHAVLDRAVLMVQREVADRITAQPGSRDYGLLSVTVQMYGPAEKLFTLPPASFSPPPDVHSTVFRWRFAPRFAELGVEEASFLAFVRKAFAQKRKTLANNLRAAGVSPAAAAAALARAAINPQARAEALSIEAFAALWQSLNAEKAASSIEAAPPSESSSG
jgi:16S rRNA (adenine1518-N6/adenine1519-N6)-dimethyltransferase